MKSRIACILLNLTVPGLGQLAMGAWTKGVIMITGAIASVVWFLYEALMPLWYVYRGMGEIEDIEFHLGFMLASLAVLLIIYLWSMADVIFCYSPAEGAKEEK